MKNTRAIIVLVLAVLAGLAAVVMAAKWLNQRGGGGAQLVVAARDLNLGQPLEATALTSVSWSAAVLPDGGFRDPKELEGRVLRTAVTRGEPILESKLAAKGSKGGLSAVIGAGKRAITVKVNEVVGVAGFALPGSHVDVMVHTTVDDESNKRNQGAAMSKIVLERILVLAIAQEASRDETKPKVVSAVTLEVTPDQAELLDVARSVGSLSLVLRNQLDTQPTHSMGMSKSDLFATNPAASAPPAPVAVAPPRPAPVKRVVAAAPTPKPEPTKPAAPPPEAKPDLTKIEVIRGVSRSTVEM